jgi:hypothetical protein
MEAASCELACAVRSAPGAKVLSRRCYHFHQFSELALIENQVIRFL